MPRVLPTVLLPFLVVLAACGGGDPQPDDEAPTTAQAVTERMLDRFETNQAAATPFTVVAEGARARITASADSAGPEPLQINLAPVGSRPVGEAAQLLYNIVPNVPLFATALRDALLSGPVERGGRRAYVLTTDDPGSLTGGVGRPGESSELRVYVDTETFDVLEIFQAATLDSLEATLGQRIVYGDFRETDGLTLPFTLRQTQTGANQLIPQEERIRRGGELALALNRAEQMPRGPEREATIRAIESEQRLYEEGVLEAELTVESVTLDRAADVSREAAPDATP